MKKRSRSAIVASAKAFERRIAKMIGGKRNPSVGDRAQIDVESDLLTVQAKKGQRQPDYLLEWIDEHRKQSPSGDHRLPLVVWSRWRKPDPDALFIGRLGDLITFMEWQGLYVSGRNPLKARED